MEDQLRIVRWFTVSLWVIAILMALVATSASLPISVAQRGGDQFLVQVLRAAQIAYGVFACLLCLTATLRGINSQVGAQLTAATCIALALIFPFGTAIFLVWVLLVRPKERWS